MTSVTGVDDGAGWGVKGTSSSGTGVVGEGAAYAGVVANSATGAGVSTFSDSGAGVLSVSNSGPGVAATSTGNHGVTGSTSSHVHAGVLGENPTGAGVFGTSVTRIGVQGTTRDDIGVFGWVVPADDSDPDTPGPGRGVVGVAGSGTGVEGSSGQGVGVWGESKTGEGVHGQTHSRSKHAVVALQLEPHGVGAALYAEHRNPNGVAGYFQGNVVVTGHLEFTGADCAEEFDLTAGAEDVDPGTVMVIGDEEALTPSSAAYDRRVAGVIAGAGDVHPALVLGASGARRVPRAQLALVGRVWCKVDAGPHPIGVGDLLTTSHRRGHAMAVSDHEKARGAVVGKALRALASGTGLIPVLVGLQ